ncbi:MAG TPA: hypothetical protein VN873_02050 [Candidatus Angelobacter sp.]|nr:hypothetical protein [Candidatus Angelobacter sp.]
MFRRVGQLLMIIAVLSATGTHWLALQSVAWTAMLAENLHTSSFKQAIRSTFDGKHPCCLCKEIARDKQSEKKSDVQFDLKKLDLSLGNFEIVFRPPSASHELQAANESADSLTRAPSVPPPRQLPG